MEQRRARRFDLKLPFELIRRGSQSLSQHGETQNLSSMGVLFQAPTNNLRVGEPVEYIITLPTHPGSDVLDYVAFFVIGSKHIERRVADECAHAIEMSDPGNGYDRGTRPRECASPRVGPVPGAYIQAIASSR